MNFNLCRHEQKKNRYFILKGHKKVSNQVLKESYIYDVSKKKKDNKPIHKDLWFT